MNHVAVLFARSDSNYRAIPGTDVFDLARDARTFRGGMPVVAHPPCRSWGRLRHFAKPRADEKALALFAVDQVRRWGGVLEHPAHSTLWGAAGLPLPGGRDVWGGFTLPVSQSWWGHKARKDTWLYVCGIEPAQLPPVPFALGDGTHVIGQRRSRAGGVRVTKQDPRWRPEVTKAEREHTPPLLCAWLVDLARRCQSRGMEMAA